MVAHGKILHEHLKQNANGQLARASSGPTQPFDLEGQSGTYGPMQHQKDASDCFSSEFDRQRTEFSMVVRRSFHSFVAGKGTGFLVPEQWYSSPPLPVEPLFLLS